MEEDSYDTLMVRLRRKMAAGTTSIPQQQEENVRTEPPTNQDLDPPSLQDEDQIHQEHNDLIIRTSRMDDEIPNWCSIEDDDDTDSLLDYRSAIADSISTHRSIHTPSLLSYGSESLGTLSEENTINEEDITIGSVTSLLTANNEAESAEELNADLLPKSFLQLKGIAVANFNMGCNFNISLALRLMVHYDLYILAIQEHTPWSREITPGEYNAIERICNRNGFFATITKLQILIIDKRLTACHRDTSTYEDGRIIQSRFEVTHGEYVVFISTYGIPHTSNNSRDQQNLEENTILQAMARVQRKIKVLITQALRNKVIPYVFGDLQDTPNNSRSFHYGNCRIPKHPLGIVKACEDANLTCTIFKHLDTMELPVISRHGTKGGRFIDGMFTTQQGLLHITGTIIIQDTGIQSDHDMVVSKLDLGLKKFIISTAKEERVNYQLIMNIPLRQTNDSDHPVLDDNVYKGVDFRHHQQLYATLQQITKEEKFQTHITAIKDRLEMLEEIIIERTKMTINPDDQKAGKLVTRLPDDAVCINTASTDFFALIHDICKEAGIVSVVHSLPAATIEKNRRAIKQEKIFPEITSVPLTRQINDTFKRIKSVYHRLRIILKQITENQRMHGKRNTSLPMRKQLKTSIRRFCNQQHPFRESIHKTIMLYHEVAEDRQNHIQAIEHSRNKRIFDNMNQYQTYAINQQGKDEYDVFLHETKEKIFGAENVPSLETEAATNIPRCSRLQLQLSQWVDAMDFEWAMNEKTITPTCLKEYYSKMIQGRNILRNMTNTIKQIRTEEWRNAKTHFIRIGKTGNIARMINPKVKTGPSASGIYPSKPGDPVRRATNDHERQEASILTHTPWMDNPPGLKNCHFLDIIEDEVGPCGVSINPNKPFDDEAKWKYLDGLLHEKLDEETEARVTYAHQRLPELFSKIKSDQTIIYPFRYDCESGEYLYADLNKNLRKNICQGNGKARATGFSIPVLGCLPKCYVDTYFLKYKLQLALRLLDMGTECSLRICIAKPCGGVRPLTVGHDDNVFLNGLAQQADQREIARLKVLPPNLCSYQKGKGCSDATIVDSIVKEVALQ